jgi:hypothetical protein
MYNPDASLSSTSWKIMDIKGSTRPHRSFVTTRNQRKGACTIRWNRTTDSIGVHRIPSDSIGIAVTLSFGMENQPFLNENRDISCSERGTSRRAQVALDPTIEEMGGWVGATHLRISGSRMSDSLEV